MFGGKPLQGHSIPEVYGAIEATGVFVPLQSILGSPDAFRAATTEVFGPLQVPASCLAGAAAIAAAAAVRADTAECAEGQCRARLSQEECHGPASAAAPAYSLSSLSCRWGAPS